MAFGFFNKISPPAVESVQSLELRVSGMRGTQLYELTVQNGTARLEHYAMRYSEKREERVLLRQATCDATPVLALLNACRLPAWHGFHGAHPRGVRDGIMFSLRAVYNGDTNLQAEGSQNFPPHYRAFTDGLNDLLNQYGEEC